MEAEGRRLICLNPGMTQKGRGEGHSEENAYHQVREPGGHNLWYYVKYV